MSNPPHPRQADFRAWLAECCVLDPAAVGPSLQPTDLLLISDIEWMGARGMAVGPTAQRQHRRWLRTAGVRLEWHQGVLVYRGITLVTAKAKTAPRRGPR